MSLKLSLVNAHDVSNTQKLVNKLTVTQKNRAKGQSKNQKLTYQHRYWNNEQLTWDWDSVCWSLAALLWLLYWLLHSDALEIFSTTLLLISTSSFLVTFQRFIYREIVQQITLARQVLYYLHCLGFVNNYSTIPFDFWNKNNTTWSDNDLLLKCTTKTAVEYKNSYEAHLILRT